MLLDNSTTLSDTLFLLAINYALLTFHLFNSFFIQFCIKADIYVYFSITCKYLLQNSSTVNKGKFNHQHAGNMCLFVGIDMMYLLIFLIYMFSTSCLSNDCIFQIQTSTDQLFTNALWIFLRTLFRNHDWNNCIRDNVFKFIFVKSEKNICHV